MEESLNDQAMETLTHPWTTPVLSQLIKQYYLTLLGAKRKAFI